MQFQCLAVVEPTPLKLQCEWRAGNWYVCNLSPESKVAVIFCLFFYLSTSHIYLSTCRTVSTRPLYIHLSYYLLHHSIKPQTNQPSYLPTFPSTNLLTYISTCLPPSIAPNLPNSLPTCLSTYGPMHLPINLYSFPYVLACTGCIWLPVNNVLHNIAGASYSLDKAPYLRT